MTLAEQTAARLQRAGFSWNDPELAFIVNWNASVAAIHAEKCQGATCKGCLMGWPGPGRQ